MSEEFEDYFTEVENSLSQCTGGRDLYALKLVHKNYFRIKTGFYEDESPEEISNEICMSINEMVKDGKVTCNNCQWEWKLSEGGNDPYTCHKCGYKKNQLLEHLINERSVTDLPVRTIVREMTDIVKKEIRKSSWNNNHWGKSSHTRHCIHDRNYSSNRSSCAYYRRERKWKRISSKTNT